MQDDHSSDKLALDLQRTVLWIKCIEIATRDRGERELYYITHFADNMLAAFDKRFPAASVPLQSQQSSH